LVVWNGLEPGYYVLLGVVFLGGLTTFLLDMTVMRGIGVCAAFALVIVLLLPYRGMRLWQYSWLRLRQGWAIALARLLPERREAVARLAARLDGIAPDLAGHAANASNSARTRPLAAVRTKVLPPLAEPPTWEDALEAARGQAPGSPGARPPSWPGGLTADQLRAALAGDELDGVAKTRPLPSSSPASLPALRTLREIRAWRPQPGAERSDQA
jgi:hypothetical protein